MSELIKINNNPIRIKEFNSKRVITFKEIDEVHNKSDGSSRKRFNNNRQHFVLGEDYFVLSKDEAEKYGFKAPNGMIFVTESGYLMIVKTFEDDLSWQVQKQLVNTYFRFKEIVQAPQYALPQNYKEALLQLVGQVEENEKLQSKVLYLTPKAESFDTFINATGNLTIEETAKTLNIKGVGRNKLFEILRNEEILIKKGSGEFSYYEAYQRYIEPGYFVHKQNPIRKGLDIIKRTQVFVTPKGFNWLVKILKQRGYMEVAIWREQA